MINETAAAAIPAPQRPTPLSSASACLGHEPAKHLAPWGEGIFLLCFPEIPLSLMLMASSCHIQGTLHDLKRRMKERRALKDGEERRGDTEDLEASWRRQYRQQVL